MLNIKVPMIIWRARERCLVRRSLGLTAVHSQCPAHIEREKLEQCCKPLEFKMHFPIPTQASSNDRSIASSKCLAWPLPITEFPLSWCWLTTSPGGQSTNQFKNRNNKDLAKIDASYLLRERRDSAKLGQGNYQTKKGTMACWQQPPNNTIETAELPCYLPFLTTKGKINQETGKCYQHFEEAYSCSFWGRPDGLLLFPFPTESNKQCCF